MKSRSGHRKGKDRVSGAKGAGVVLCCALLLAFPTVSAGDVVLDVFDFSTTESARAAWVPMTGSSPVEIFAGIPGTENRGVRFPCNFETVADRCYWDTTFAADLSADDVFALRVFVEEPLSMSSLTLYFRSPGGWYANTVSLSTAGWQTLRFTRAGFHESSTPAGWDQITGIRFSVWKGSPENTGMIATELRFYTPPVKIVKGTRTNYPGTAEQTANLVAECLEAGSIEYGMVTDDDVEARGLGNVKLVILPYNSNLPAQEITNLHNFVQGGGTLISFYLLDPSLASLLGMQVTGVRPHSLGAMRFVPGIVDCIPDRAEQASWNVNETVPATSETRVLAYWEDDAGEPLDKAAWLINPRGAFMTHILLNDDLDRKRRVLVSLVAYFLPEAIPGIRAAAIDAILPVGQYTEFDEAVTGIVTDAELTARLAAVQEEVNRAAAYREQAIDSVTSDSFCRTVDLATSSRLHLLEGYYLAQRSRVPEFRGVWESAGTGIYPGDWNRSAALLRSCGLNAVLPIVSTGGTAHYDSALLPHSSTFETYGDQAAQCVAACRGHSIQAHPRKITWRLLWTSQDFIDTMRAQGRTQVDVDGNPVDWLCPSDPRNYQLELDSIMEVVANYDVDGFHYDYIRYPDSKTCYCSLCRERFTSDTGQVVTNWPEDCYSGSLREVYREWRREQITRLVRNVHAAVQAVKPQVRISAAVFSGYPACRDTVGQDWVYWMEQGYVDFACPMDYTPSLNVFRNWVTGQSAYVAGHGPLYPGIGVRSSSSTLSPDQVIAQIRITRDNNTGGFVLFNFVPSVAEYHLPILAKGITEPNESLTGFQLH